jgi:hypothetical protein
VLFGDSQSIRRFPVEALFTWKGMSPEDYLGNSSLMQALSVWLVPRSDLVPPTSIGLGLQGKVNFPDVPPGYYHLVFEYPMSNGNDLYTRNNLDVHATSANIVGYWCRPSFYMDGKRTVPVDPVDLFWDNDALPRIIQREISSGSFSLPAESSLERGIFRGGVDAFTFSAIARDDTTFQYSVVVTDASDPFRTRWFSPWASADSSGKVTIPWNGYVLKSGTAQTASRVLPPATNDGSERLEPGNYAWAIQFRENIAVDTNGNKGIGYPEMLSVYTLRTPGGLAEGKLDEGLEQGEQNFYPLEFGMTLYCPFQLVQDATASSN